METPKKFPAKPFIHYTLSKHKPVKKGKFDRDGTTVSFMFVSGDAVEIMEHEERRGRVECTLNCYFPLVQAEKLWDDLVKKDFELTDMYLDP